MRYMPSHWGDEIRLATIVEINPAFVSSWPFGALAVYAKFTYQVVSSGVPAKRSAKWTSSSQVCPSRWYS